MSLQDKTAEQNYKNALGEHARFAASRAKARLGGALSTDNLNIFLSDSQCLRFPTEIVYSREGLEAHQFAQPFIVHGDNGQKCRLHVDPLLQEHPEEIYLIVAYMAAIINYGEAATTDIAELQGSLLTEMPKQEFYNEICRVADSIALQHYSQHP